jgi:hypothetical protein
MVILHSYVSLPEGNHESGFKAEKGVTENAGHFLSMEMAIFLVENDEHHQTDLGICCFLPGSKNRSWPLSNVITAM